MAKIVDPDKLLIGTNIAINTTAKTFTLSVGGELIAKDGVTLQCLYSFFVKLWSSNPTYQPFPFPMYAIDALSGQFQFGTDGATYNGWQPTDSDSNVTRQMLRDGGWSEYSSGGVLWRQYVGIVSLGNVFPEGVAQLYYQREATGSPANFTFKDEVNEGIQVFGALGHPSSFDTRNFFKGFVREAGYKYKDSVLGDTGKSNTGAYIVNMLLSNETDLDIVASDIPMEADAIDTASWAGGTVTYNCDAPHDLTNGDWVFVTGCAPSGYNISGQCTVSDEDTFTLPLVANPGALVTPGSVAKIYSKIVVRYFSSAFTKDIDTVGVGRNFGIVIDAGTLSGIDGVAADNDPTFNSAAGGFTADMVGGTLHIWEGGAVKGTYAIVTHNDANEIMVDPSFPAGPTSGLSFTIEPAVDYGITLQQIYTKVQFLLRYPANINSATGSVTGKTASLLLNFVGSRLDCGYYLPTNPIWAAGTGVLVEGMAPAYLNSIRFYDNTGLTGAREYPYQSSGTLNFNAVLTSGSTGYYRMYFTTNPTGNYGTSTAVTVNDASGDPITGTINGASISFTFDYTGNNQGGRTPNEDADVTIIAGNAGSAKPVVSTATIAASKGLAFTLTAEQDRAYNNP